MFIVGDLVRTKDGTGYVDYIVPLSARLVANWGKFEVYGKLYGVEEVELVLKREGTRSTRVDLSTKSTKQGVDFLSFCWLECCSCRSGNPH